MDFYSWSRQIDLDTYAKECISVHTSYTPFWKKYEKKRNICLGKIDSFDRLIEELPIFPSSFLKKINPIDLIPSLYTQENLLESVSSGTTGKPKSVYWSQEEIDIITKFAAYCLSLQDFPKNEKWIGTETQNKVLKKYLRDLAKELDSQFEGIEVNENIVRAVKKAAESGNIKGMVKAYAPVIEKIMRSIQQDARVYEDATLGLLISGQTLKKRGLNEKIKGILFGGVATSSENIKRLREIFPNSNIGGWYGNHFSGVVMYRPRKDFSTLQYQPPFPLVTITIRKKSNLKEIVDYGERGVVVATRISRYLLLSLELGDEATRVKPIEPFNWDAVADVTRLGKKESKTIEKELYSQYF